MEVDMLEALNRKKKELEAVIDNYNAEIAKLEVERESAESKLALVDELIDEESKPVPEVTEESEKVVVVTYGSSQN